MVLLIKILFYVYLFVFVHSINEDNPFINKYEWNEIIELKEYANNNKNLKFTSNFKIIYIYFFYLYIYYFNIYFMNKINIFFS